MPKMSGKHLLRRCEWLKDKIDKHIVEINKRDPERDPAVSGVLDPFAVLQVCMCIAHSSPLDMLHRQAVGTLPLTFISLCTVE